MEQSVITDILLPAALFIIMLGMGLSLTIEDFKRVISFPKSIAVGLMCQIVLLPILGFMVCKLMNLQAEFAVGIMVLAACPGGVTSNLISHLAKGNVALSVTLTAISSTLSVFTTPLVIGYAASMYLSDQQHVVLPFSKTVVSIFVITILPIALGMLVRAQKQALSTALERPVKIASTAFLVLIIMGALLKDKAVFSRPDIFMIVGATLFLNVISLLLSYFLPLGLALPKRDAITISIETGIQNATLGIFIGATLLKNPNISVIPAMYGLLMFATAGIIIPYFSKQNLS